MIALRADPWTPDHGMGFDVAPEEPPAHADPFVERPDWSVPLRPRPGPSGPVAFVDGVRRVELRLVADEHGVRAPGLFGSFAVGSVVCNGRAVFDRQVVGHALVLGGGLRPPRVEIRVGRVRLEFEPATETGSDPDRPLWGLQQLMRSAEAALATQAAGSGEHLVLADGPLTFLDPTVSPVVGVVKRFARAYLDPEHDALIPRLGPGERTPIFGLGRPKEHPLERFAWYLRLVPVRSPWHDHAGVVRCEVRAGVGIDAAIDIADRVTSLLPDFVGRPTDPRYPQNLAPVAGLEGWLQHRMGHRRLIWRALNQWLARGQEGSWRS